MKKLCIWLAVIAVIVIGLGFYRGWFAVTGGREPDSKDISVELSVDADKVKKDAESVTGGLKNKDTQNKDAQNEP